MNNINKKQGSLIKVRAYAFSFFLLNALAVFVTQGELPDAFWGFFLVGFIYFSGLVVKYGVSK